MKFELGDKIKCDGGEGIVIVLYYHKVMVKLNADGCCLLNKKDVEKI